MFGQKSSHLPTRSRYHCQEISKKHYIVVVDEVRIWACWGGANLPESQLTKNIRYKIDITLFSVLSTPHTKKPGMMISKVLEVFNFCRLVGEITILYWQISNR
jgi:hypothetical protein